MVIWLCFGFIFNFRTYILLEIIESSDFGLPKIQGDRVLNVISHWIDFALHLFDGRSSIFFGSLLLWGGSFLHPLTKCVFCLHAFQNYIILLLMAYRTYWDICITIIPKKINRACTSNQKLHTVSPFMEISSLRILPLQQLIHYHGTLGCMRKWSQHSLSMH